MSDSSSSKRSNKLKVQDLQSHPHPHPQKPYHHSAFSTSDALERTHQKNNINSLDQYRNKLSAYESDFDSYPQLKPTLFETVQEEVGRDKENVKSWNRQDLINERDRRERLEGKERERLEGKERVDWKTSQRIDQKTAKKTETAGLVRRLYSECGGPNYELEYRKKKFFHNFMPS